MFEQGFYKFVLKAVLLFAVTVHASSSNRYYTDESSTESLLFIASANSCQNACNVSMHNVARIVEHYRPARKVLTSVYVSDVRKSTAKFFSDELGFAFRDSLSPLMQTLTKGMHQPLVIISGTDGRYLIIDALHKRRTDVLDTLIGSFLRRSNESRTESYILRTPLKSVDTMEITHVQALSDSLVLCYDAVRGEAGIADISGDTMIHTARLPRRIKDQFRSAGNADAWDQYVQMGVKMTQVQLAYAPSALNNDIVLAFSQMYFKSDEERRKDTGMAKQVDLRGRMARWVSRSSAQSGNDDDQGDTACVSRISLLGLAPQRVGGVSVFSGGTRDYYSSDPDSQFVVAYANESGEHPIIPRSHLSHPDSSFNLRGYTFASAMINGRLMISHPRNSIFGIYDTVGKELLPVRAVGPLALLCNAKTFEKKVSGYIGPEYLVDSAADQFLCVSYAAIDPQSQSAPLGLVLNVYNATTGEHQYSKVFNTESELAVFRFKVFNIINDVLYAVSQNSRSTTLVKIKL